MWHDSQPSCRLVPGKWCEASWPSCAWNEAGVKQRHFVVDGNLLKLFGRRGKTYKGRINLLSVTALRPASDPSAPPGTIELQVGSPGKPQTYLMAPDRSQADLFMALGNSVPSDATSDDLWRTHMRSRPAAGLTGSSTQEYRMGKTLGTGTFGKVKLAQRLSDGIIVAIKCLNRTRIVLANSGGRLAREIALLKMLNHPNVIRLHEVLHTKTEILMVMEYVEGGDLLEVLNTQPRFGEQEARHIFAQICCGVSFCHSLGVAHRDLKPENILIERCRDEVSLYRIRVADFGLSTLMNAGEMLSTACGSPHYVAPEILNFEGNARYDGRESDVWSLGVILHVMLCYKLPFEAESTSLLYKKIRRGLPSMPPHICEAARVLLTRMLEVTPSRRATLADVMRSDFLAGSTIARKAPAHSQLVNAVVDSPVVEGQVISGARIAMGPHVRRVRTLDALPSLSSAARAGMPSYCVGYPVGYDVGVSDSAVSDGSPISDAEF